MPPRAALPATACWTSFPPWRGAWGILECPTSCSALWPLRMRKAGAQPPHRIRLRGHRHDGFHRHRYGGPWHDQGGRAGISERLVQRDHHRPHRQPHQRPRAAGGRSGRAHSGGHPGRHYGSTADSQMLAAASSVSQNILQEFAHLKLTEKAERFSRPASPSSASASWAWCWPATPTPASSASSALPGPGLAALRRSGALRPVLEALQLAGRSGRDALGRSDGLCLEVPRQPAGRRVRHL